MWFIFAIFSFDPSSCLTSLLPSSHTFQPYSQHPLEFLAMFNHSFSLFLVYFVLQILLHPPQLFFSLPLTLPGLCPLPCQHTILGVPAVCTFVFSPIVFFLDSYHAGGCLCWRLPSTSSPSPRSFILAAVRQEASYHGLPLPLHRAFSLASLVVLPDALLSSCLLSSAYGPTF